MRIAAIVFIALAGTSQAATLRSYREIVGHTIHLSDLFAAIGNTPDHALGRAPAPGEKITVEAPQLAAIARDFGVDWRPETGSERAVLLRRGQTLPAGPIRADLAAALRHAGAPLDGDVLMPAFQPPIVDPDAAPATEIAQVSFDPQSGRFTAMLLVRTNEGDAPSLRLSGQVVSMRDAATLTRRLPLGTLITASDVTSIRVRAAALHGEVPLLPGEAAGMALRHDVPPGQPLTTTDLMRPLLVARGASVRMTLDADGIALNAGGVALEAGGLGERIRVQNPTSRAVITGEIVGDGQVRVSPGTAVPVTLAIAQ